MFKRQGYWLFVVNFCLERMAWALGSGVLPKRQIDADSAP
jgi:hypothetical protein